MTSRLDVPTGSELPARKAPWSPPTRSDLGSLLDAAFMGGPGGDGSDSEAS